MLIYEKYLVQIFWMDLYSDPSARDFSNDSGNYIHGAGMYGHC